MLRQLSEEQQMLQRTVREFVEGEIKPHAEAWDERQEFPAAVFRKFGEMGLLGMMVPTEYGGSGMDAPGVTMVLEEVGRGCAATALSLGAHAVLCANNLYRNASEEQRRKYLPDLCSGARLGGVAITEPGAGSDAVGMTTRAVRKGDKYILNGTKMFITNGPVGGVFVVYAKTGEKGPKSLSTFIVESGFPGFRVGKKLNKMGMRASPTSELVFEDMEVPAGNRMGEENGGVAQLMRGLDIERVTLAGISIGIAEASVAEASRYALERKQFGKAIGEFQMVQKMIADMVTETEAARALVYAAADAIAGGRRINREAAIAKLFASEVGTRAAMKAVQVLGGYGYIKEFPVERYARDAKLMEIGAGTSEVMRMIIARETLGRAV
ncbi:MAG: acyl-CoA dehydrogenase family protein [Deltaproteobacteria bacterium]|nr:acyl-CoA dehydrogenase family protein [Deltaproteobacteria bacterium]